MKKRLQTRFNVQHYIQYGGLLMCVLAFLVGCKTADNVQPATVTPPTVTSPYLGTPVTTVFHDDFTDNRFRWYEQNNDSLLVSIANDSLYFYNKGLYPQYLIWQWVSIDTSKNFSIKASFRSKSVSDTNAYGITWQTSYTNENNFLIKGNRTFIVDFYKNDTLTRVQNWTYNSTISPSTNLLEVRKENKIASFWVNGMMVFSLPYKPSLFPAFSNGYGFKVDGKVEIAVDYLDISEW